jgi:hypothetical protein
MITTAVAVVLCSLIVSQALCGEPSPRDFFVGGGWSVPLYPGNWASGYTISAGLLTSVAPFAKVGVSFEVGQFPAGQFPIGPSPITQLAAEKTIPSVTSELSYYGGRADVLSIGPAAKILFVDRTHAIAPYITASARYFRVRTTRAVLFQGEYLPNGPFTGDSESAFAMQLGVGVDVPLNRNAGLFFQADFVNAFTGSGGTKYLPLKAGMRFSP